MNSINKLQLFAEGESAPASEGTSSVADNRGGALRALGVPEDKVQKHLNRKVMRPWRKKQPPVLQKAEAPKVQETAQPVAEVKVPPAAEPSESIRNHYDSLHRQGQAMQSRYKDFDLGKELDNPVFLKLTAPQVGLSVEDAYMAVHHRELMEAVARGARQDAANAVRAGSMRPVEHGVSAKAPGVVTFDYKNATRSEREAFKKEIYAAAARGEKIYPR